MQVFWHGDVVKEFTDYLYTILAKVAEKNKTRIIVFAHNSKGYDGHFIMQDLFKRKFADKPQIILQGLKVLKIGVNNVDFIDSLSFFQQPLSALPKSFGFESVVLKGFFPHRFNTPENSRYVGPIPALEYFGLEHMKESTSEECRQWHANYGSRNYRLFQELKDYCKNDVKILTMAVMEFRELFKKVTELDPITRNFTLASVAMEHFRSSVLQENQIGITPIKGYVNNRNKSNLANHWLDWCQKTTNQIITREYKIGPFFADGYAKETRTVYEFFGCFFHGCDRPGCNRNKDRFAIDPYLGKSLSSVYIQTEERVSFSILIILYINQFSIPD